MAKVRSAAIAAASSGSNEVVAAPGAGKRIRVWHYTLSFSGSVNAKWQSAATDRTGLYYGAANTQVTTPFGPFSEGVREPLFVCGVNEALNLNLSGAVAVGGMVDYDVEA